MQIALHCEMATAAKPEDLWTPKPKYIVFGKLIIRNNDNTELFVELTANWETLVVAPGMGCRVSVGLPATMTLDHLALRE